MIRTVQRHVKKQVPPAPFAHITFERAVAAGQAKLASGADPRLYLALGRGAVGRGGDRRGAGRATRPVHRPHLDRDVIGRRVDRRFTGGDERGQGQCGRGH